MNSNKIIGLELYKKSKPELFPNQNEIDSNISLINSNIERSEISQVLSKMTKLFSFPKLILEQKDFNNPGKLEIFENKKLPCSVGNPNNIDLRLIDGDLDNPLKASSIVQSVVKSLEDSDKKSNSDTCLLLGVSGVGKVFVCFF